MSLTSTEDSSPGSSRIDPDGELEQFYEHGKEYWEKISPTVDGMLGGFAHISSTDIGGSNKFLRQFIRGANPRTTSECALDCGAGIGRITKLLLTTLFDRVDMVEQNEEFLKNAPSYLGQQARKVDKLICSGLQSFTPEPARYNVIWCQWVMGHLVDSDFIGFLQRCKQGLKEGGIIVLKENMNSNPGVDFDECDSSFTRPKDSYVELMLRSGLKIIKQEKQKNFPKDIYDVWMFALA